MRKVIISKKRLRKLIREAIEAEKVAYHGSGASFDKFNHKKFLSSGAGSQSFGWGTYVAEDPVIARGYADSMAQEKAKENETTPSLLYNGKEIWQDEICQIYRCPVEVAQLICHLISYRKYDSLVKYLSELQQEILDKDWEIKNQITDDNELKMAERMKNKFRYAFNVISHMMDDKNLKYGTFEDAYIYEVDIPEDNGFNYIEWNERLPREQMRAILLGFGRLSRKWIEMIQKNNYPFRCTFYGYICHPQFEKIVDIMVNDEDYSSFFASGFCTNEKTNIGRQVYRYLQSLFGSDKAVSLYLMQCGFDGIKYESGTRWKKPNGAMEYSENYVIFDANKVKIIKKDNIN